MDTSETNIKMCEKAVDIQEEWLPQRGDVFAHKRDKEKRVVERNPIYEAGCGHGIADEGDLLPLAVNWSDRRDRYVWLPHQDQLQEMVAPLVIPAMASETSTRSQRLALALSTFCFNSLGYHTKYTDQFTSMEQLWLAFVMKENHNKVWNGEDWIKEGNNDKKLET